MSTAPNPTRNPALTAALGYAARGWAVFPLRPGSKKPATPNHSADRCDGTDPRCRDGHTGWQDRATTDPGRITRAWTTTPGYGIGIACGPSALVVVDLDTPKPDTALPPPWTDLGGVVDGADVLAVLADRAGAPLPYDTHTVTTPTGGTHLYFTAPTAVQLHNTTARLGPLIDTRASGGYVAAPPTTGYHLTHATDPAPLPTWLTTALTSSTCTRSTSTSSTSTRSTSTPDVVSRYAAAALTRETGRVVHAAPGTRNQSLFVAALALGQLVGAGALDGEHVTTTLLDAVTGHVAAGAFSTAEAAATIASGLRRGTADPRTLPTRQDAA